MKLLLLLLLLYHYYCIYDKTAKFNKKSSQTAKASSCIIFPEQFEGTQRDVLSTLLLYLFIYLFISFISANLVASFTRFGNKYNSPITFMNNIYMYIHKHTVTQRER